MERMPFLRRQNKLDGCRTTYYYYAIQMLSNSSVARNGSALFARKTSHKIIVINVNNIKIIFLKKFKILFI